MGSNLFLFKSVLIPVVVFYKKTNKLKIDSLSTIINGNVNIIFYYSKDVVPPSLRSIS